MFAGTSYRGSCSARTRLASRRFFASCSRFCRACFVCSCWWCMSLRGSSGCRGGALELLGMLSSLFLLFDTAAWSRHLHAPARPAPWRCLPRGSARLGVSRSRSSAALGHLAGRLVQVAPAHLPTLYPDIITTGGIVTDPDLKDEVRSLRAVIREREQHALAAAWVVLSM